MEVKSCPWALIILQASTASSLLVQIKQSYNKLDILQCGGLTLFKLIVDKIDACSFKSTQVILTFLQRFDLPQFDGKDMAVATTPFKAAVKVLPCSDEPSDILVYYLKGMSKASNEDFRLICSSQLGFLYIPMYSESAHQLGSKMVELDKFATTVLSSLVL